jgi:imidazolonepropionase-like amidohydrolase
VADVLRSARKAQPRWCWAQARWLGAHGRNAEEFIYRVQDGGDTPMDALLTGTSVAAESLRMADRIGLLAQGKEADIVALDGNPLDDITVVRRDEAWTGI